MKTDLLKTISIFIDNKIEQIQSLSWEYKSTYSNALSKISMGINTALDIFDMHEISAKEKREIIPFLRKKIKELEDLLSDLDEKEKKYFGMNPPECNHRRLNQNINRIEKTIKKIF